jgi:hypothetical protein
VKFELEGSSAAISRDLGGAAALAVSGVRRYIVRTKQAEARNVVGQLAKSVAMWWEREDVDAKGKLISFKTKKLFSIPATPREIPKGTKYQSSPDDWKPWQQLHFEMAMPQYYQYEIKAAKDGESADIIARGDLNGDGKPGVFVLHIAVQRPENTVRLGTTITETSPDE